MYNINIYSYWKAPYTNNNKFSIYPLNDPGKKKYYSNQSHNYHYLKKTDPFVLKSITGMDYETLVKEQEDNINELNKVNKSFKLKQNQSQKVIFDENKNSYFNNLQNDSLQDENLQNSNIKNENKSIIKSQSQENYLTNKKRPNNIYSEKIIENLPFNPKNPKTKHYFYEYRKPKNFFETLGYNISKKSDIEKYKDEINKLKYKTRLMSASSKNIKYNNNNNFEKPFSNSFKIYNQKLTNSMEKYYKNGVSDDEIEKIENQKLNMNLLNQTSKKFRFKYKLPDLCKIAFHKKIIRNVNNGNKKELGENYNPYSLIHPNKNRTARNYIGDLFKH